MVCPHREGLFGGFRFSSEHGPQKRREILAWCGDGSVLNTMGNPSAYNQTPPRGKGWPTSLMPFYFYYYYIFSFYMRVCECLIMTEKRRGNASLPLMSVVKSPLPLLLYFRSKPKGNRRKSSVSWRTESIMYFSCWGDTEEKGFDAIYFRLTN